MLDRMTQTLDFQGQALVLRSERQRLIASNIANADTPGYMARDFDFGKALREAIGASSSTNLATSQASHMGLNGSPPGTPQAPDLLYATASQTNLDSNSVDMDRERANFADNSVHYEATLRFINSHVKTMLTAISGQ